MPYCGTPGLIPAGAGQTPSRGACCPGTRAHPRGCGADSSSAETASSPPGSSPRVRGRRHFWCSFACVCGLIPAGAGQTASATAPTKTRWAHPRGCGADGSLNSGSDARWGSSPRVRGRQGRSPSPAATKRLIPAGAGQTSFLVLLCVRVRAHPRGCGADRLCDGTYQDPLGSSPRVRGRRVFELRERREVGLIPAGAGQTGPITFASGNETAHPRGCGADSSHAFFTHVIGGSSPRVRGRRYYLAVRLGIRRLIPAGAGQTKNRHRKLRRAGAHPRGCGADTNEEIAKAEAEGSSPRVRGRPLQRSESEDSWGLIPAGAGQTCAAWLHAWCRRAHPRGCGADGGTDHVDPGIGGSSPRVRGRHRPPSEPRPTRRLIPAGAGQTPKGL